jgi:hypothetical protein
MAESESSKSELTETDFGIFYPRGHLVAAFPKREDAERVRKDLLTGGYDPQDCLLFSSKGVARDARRNLKENTGFLARLGKSDEAVAAHLNAAEHGRSFLVIYAPGDLEAERAMTVVHRVPFDFVHRYHRFAIQVLK